MQISHGHRNGSLPLLPDHLRLLLIMLWRVLELCGCFSNSSLSSPPLDLLLRLSVFQLLPPRFLRTSRALHAAPRVTDHTFVLSDINHWRRAGYRQGALLRGKLSLSARMYVGLGGQMIIGKCVFLIVVCPLLNCCQISSRVGFLGWRSTFRHLEQGIQLRGLGNIRATRKGLFIVG